LKSDKGVGEEKKQTGRMQDLDKNPVVAGVNKKKKNRHGKKILKSIKGKRGCPKNAPAKKESSKEK